MAAELTFGVRSSKTRVWSLQRGNLGNEMAGGLSGTLSLGSLEL